MQSEDKHQEQDQNHHPYPQPDSTRVIWKALQGLKLELIDQNGQFMMMPRRNSRKIIDSAL
ncbi:unnamed protein product [Brassica rapa]|uniref:Uncharacterized protein n=1 Tax=Brassica campestris TaxID=3711 RepID=A0A8D9D543_BRACM|nr:unnamed protein product [Brassica rapa]